MRPRLTKVRRTDYRPGPPSGPAESHTKALEGLTPTALRGILQSLKADHSPWATARKAAARALLKKS